MTDYLRVFGLLALQENRDFVERLGRGRSNRYELDDPSQKEQHLWTEIARQFNDTTIEICSPDCSLYIEGSHEFDPNDDRRIQISHEGQ